MSRWFVAMSFVLGVLLPLYADAAMLTFVRDLISTSAPGVPADHTIEFTLTHAVPGNGMIVITPQGGQFTIPANFDYAAVDFATSNGGPYVDRSLANVNSAAVDGVSVVSGTSGSITVALSSIALPAGTKVQLRLGSIATYGTTSSSRIINPTANGSYKIKIATYDSGMVALDAANAMIATIDPVGLSLSPPLLAPTIFNGQPTSTIAAGNTILELSLETDKSASCRYATTTGVTYAAMTNSFSPQLGQLFFTTLSGFQDGTTYSYYVRCASNGKANDTDYVIRFSLAPTPSSSVSVTDGGTVGVTSVNLGNGGAGDFPSGSSVLYLASVRVSGWSSPGSTVSFLKDGTPYGTTQAGSDGSFSKLVSNIERGTYTIQNYATDSKGRKSALIASTLDLGSASNNSLENVLIPPTMNVDQEAVNPGTSIQADGESIPGSTVLLDILRQSNLALVRELTASTTASGDWQLTIDTSKLAKDAYVLKARSVVRQSQSGWSTPIPITIGSASGAPSGGNRSDLNKDGKVNLVDFSILLSNWKTADANSDINQDGVVNLADFSILLFNWTG